MISSLKSRFIFICAIIYSSEILCLLPTTNPIRSVAFDRRNQLSLESTVETIESNFEKSWVENNIIANSVKHSSFDWVCGTLRGLQATTGQFKKGSAVISVPIGETLSSSDAGEQGCPSGLEEVWKELKATSRVSMLLLEQWSKSKEKGKSKFSSYIEALPTPGSLGTPFHWTDECLDTFPYTPLVTSVKLQRQKWVELYSKIENTGSFKGISYERFVWAMEIVRSRAFTGVGSKSNSIIPIAGTASLALIGAAITASRTAGISDAIPIVLGSLGMLCIVPALLSSTESTCVLLPAIDSSNHQGTNPVCNIALQPIKGAFQMIANRDIVVAEQITISYGNRNNDDLLQYFGFVEVDCAFDRYIVQDPLSELRKVIDSRIKNDGNSDINLINLQIIFEKFVEGKTLSTSSFIITRDDISTWKIDSLEDLELTEKKKLMKFLFQSEIMRIETGMKKLNELFSRLDVNKEKINPCVIKTFLTQKIEVLNCAMKLL